MKALPKKRKYPAVYTLLGSLSKTSMLKCQALWYSSFVAAYIWFMYWIAYDFFIWHKPFLEVNPLNYAGAIATISFIWAGTKLFSHNRIKTTNKRNTLLQPPAQQLPPEQKITQTLAAKSIPKLESKRQPKKPVAASTISGCAYHLGYLNQRERSQEIPTECLTCQHVIRCMTYQN